MYILIKCLDITDINLIYVIDIMSKIFCYNIFNLGTVGN